jgi:hypothetical protein
VFEVYGYAPIRGIGPGSRREGRLRLLLKDLEDAEALGSLCAKALHGYVARNGLSKDVEADFVPANHFNLDSVMRPSHLDENVSAAESAWELRKAGRRKPFKMVTISDKWGGGQEPKLRRGDHVPA